ncbi:butyrophilin subfamily 1 member A1-like [Plectropomus leopardus]|uniref:butyrophilin subfamily 1 member A1-like n=1 Tax=Plectropomus leopardus TaxID=160734 RepID=UPI001C4AD942|nr:butyrophilin subfamily 1 member A1-like [Plectropomus leopardus]
MEHSKVTPVIIIVLHKGAVSEPKLLITSAEGGGVTLQCEAACWLPEPQITFLDDYGKIIPADEPKRHQDASGCFTVRRTLTLRDATKRVSCRVQQPETKQTRDAHTIVPDGHGRICSLTTNIAVGGGVLLLAAPLCMLAVFLWRKFGKSAKASTSSMIRQSSDESTQSSSSESRLLLHSVMVVKDDTIEKKSITIEMLTTKVADLNSKLHEKDETILQLQKNNSQLRAAVVLPANRRGPSASADTSAPKSGGQPQKKGRRPRLTRQNSLPAPEYPTHKARSHSCPVISGLPALPTSSSASTAVKKLGSIGRSMSDACPQPRLKAKLKRQLSFVDPSTVNRILLLEDLTEESD